MDKIPASVSDVLLHNKVNDRTEQVVLPITRYNNVLNAPKVTKDSSNVNGAPFTLLTTGTEVLNTSELRKLVPGII